MSARPTSGRWKPWLIRAELALLVAGTVALVVAYRSQLGQLSDLDPIAIAVPATWFALAVTVLGLRWWMVLRSLGHRLALRTAILVTVRSGFYVVFLPMGAAAEAYRVGIVRDRLPSASMSSILASIFLDRLIGLLSLISLAGACAFAGSGTGLLGQRLPDHDMIRGGASFLALATVVAIGLAGAGAYIARRALARYGWIRPHAVPMVSAYLVAIGGHIFTSAAIWHSIAAMGIVIEPADVGFVYSASAVTALIPISLVGLTPAELSSFALYNMLGYPFAEAIKMAAVLLALRILGALFGGFLIALGHAFDVRRPRSRIPS